MSLEDLDSTVAAYKEALANRDSKREEKTNAENALALAQEAFDASTVALSEAQQATIDAKDAVIGAVNALAE